MPISGYSYDEIKTAAVMIAEYVVGYYATSNTGYTARTAPYMAKSRADTYVASAKKAGSDAGKSPLVALIALQDACRGPDPPDFVATATYVYCPQNMTPQQLTGFVVRSRERRFGNCEQQALEVALHLWAIGIRTAYVESNRKISHNYVVIPDGAPGGKDVIVDPWAGNLFIVAGDPILVKYKRLAENIEVVQAFQQWLALAPEESMFPRLADMLRTAGFPNYTAGLAAKRRRGSERSSWDHVPLENRVGTKEFEERGKEFARRPRVALDERAQFATENNPVLVQGTVVSVSYYPDGSYVGTIDGDFGGSVCFTARDFLDAGEAGRVAEGQRVSFRYFYYGTRFYLPNAPSIRLV
ncbi:MAG: hypothetical protein QM820_45195 [Minicystis sp.]